MSDVLDDLGQEFVRCALEAGIGEQTAEELARNWRDNVHLRYATDRIYIASRKNREKRDRRRIIQRDFDGTPDCRDKLCRQLGISRRTFYRLLGDGVGC